MAGHSKWHNIQHRKGAQDKKRAKIFTKLIREIYVAARQGGGDPESNPRLRLAIDKANQANMPKDNIDRAVKRGTGESGGDDFEEIRYEGYGPGGVAVMVDCLTDNRNRTAGEVRHAFSKHGGNLGADGSVGYLFSREGVLGFPPDVEEDRIMEVAIEAGADDVVTDEEDRSKEVITSPEEYHDVKKTMMEAGLEPEYSEVTERPANTIRLSVDESPTVMKLLEALEDLDDVQTVYSNADFPAEFLEESA